MCLQLSKRCTKLSRHRRNLVIFGGVLSSIVISPLLSILVVGKFSLCTATVSVRITKVYRWRFLTFFLFHHAFINFQMIGNVLGQLFCLIHILQSIFLLYNYSCGMFLLHV